MTKSTLKRTIILCWLVLLTCFIIKLLGGNWFEITITNSTYINICNWLQEHTIIAYTIRYLMNFFTCYIYYLAVTKHTKFNLTENIIVIFSLTIDWILKVIFESNSIVSGVIDAIFIAIIPLILMPKTVQSVLRIMLGIVLILIFQYISLLTRNIGLVKIDATSLIMVYVLNIDYYIMLVLYYLYSVYNNRKEKRKWVHSDGSSGEKKTLL